MNRRIRIQHLAPKDREEWQRLYYKNQQFCVRRKLNALKAVWDGQTLKEVALTQHIGYKTLERWLDSYLQGGFKKLLAPQKRPREQALSETRRKILNYIIQYKTPADYGLDSYQWTAEQVRTLLQEKWGIELHKSRIYEILHEIGLSHQRVHRDDGPSSPKERSDFIKNINNELDKATPTTAILCADEFALQSIPDTHDAWAPVNSKPTVPSDEKHREKINGLLCVELQSGHTEINFNAESTSNDIADMLLLSILVYAKLGYKEILIILDNASIHGIKMREALLVLLAEQIASGNVSADVTLRFLNTPRYSPSFNPAEYIIHEVRQKSLYHLPSHFKLKDKQKRIQDHLSQAPPLQPQQMKKIWQHIQRLPKFKKMAGC